MVDTALPYAQALISLAQENHEEDAVFHDLEQMETVMDENPELEPWLSHPAVPSAQKEALFLELFQDGTHPVFGDFLKIVSRHSMSGHLRKIAEDYRALLDELHNIQNVYVTSAAKLDENQKERLKAALKKKLGAEIRLKCSEDPSLIAGMIIRTPDAVLDASYQGKLERMKEQLLKS